MNTEEKTAFIETITANIRTDLLKVVDRIPEEWDGFELRQLLADTIKYHYNYSKMNVARFRKYNNFVLVNNLI